MDKQFTRKALLVANGHKVDAPYSITYLSAVSGAGAGIAFIILSLNDLDFFACNIRNDNHNARCREKLWAIAGKEFGPSYRGSVMIIARYLYGLKYSGRSWGEKLADKFKSIGYFSTESDPDVLLKRSVKPSGK